MRRWRNRAGDRSAREAQVLGWLFVAPAVAAVAVLVLYPLVTGFKQSIRSGGFLFGEQPGYVGLRNYKDVIHDPTSQSAMRHTVEYVVLAVAGLAGLPQVAVPDTHALSQFTPPP